MTPLAWQIVHGVAEAALATFMYFYALGVIQTELQRQGDMTRNWLKVIHERLEELIKAVKNR